MADREPSQPEGLDGVWVLLRLTDEGKPFLTLPDNVTDDQLQIVRDFFRQFGVESLPRDPRYPEDTTEE